MLKFNRNLEGKNAYTIKHVECRHRLHIIENIIEHPKDLLDMEIQSEDYYLYPTNGPWHAELKKEICAFLKNGIQEDQILLTAGSDGALQLICDTFITPESNVLVPVPTYPNMVQFIKTSAGLNPSNYKEIRIEEPMVDIESHLEHTDLVYICSPNLPLGYTITDDWLLQMVQKHTNCLFIVDEAYIEYSSQKTCVGVVNQCNNLIITRTFSKAFGLAGMRIGYAVTNSTLMNLLSIPYNCKSVTIFAIKSAITCLKNYDFYENHLKGLNESKRYLELTLARIVDKDSLIYDYTTSDAAWFFLYSHDPETVVKIFEQSGITVRDKSSDIPGAIRIAYGSLEIMKDVISVCMLINLRHMLSGKKIVFDMDGVLRPGSHSKEGFYPSAKLLLDRHTNSIVLTNNEAHPKVLEQALKDANINNALLINSTMNAFKSCKTLDLNPLIISSNEDIIDMFSELKKDKPYDSVVLIDSYWVSQSKINEICNILHSGGVMLAVDNENQCTAEDTPRGNPPVIPTGTTPSMGLFKEMFKLIGYKVETVGKPASSIADNFGIRNEYDFMIGNTLETDYEFAKNAGLEYIHVDPTLKYPKYNYDGYYVIPHIDYLV